MRSTLVFTWRKIPLLRILLSLATGIILQWHLQFPVNILWYGFLVSFLILTGLFFVPLFERYKLSLFGGVAICILFVFTGGLLTWYKDIRNDKNWIGHFYNTEDRLIVTLSEPLVQKTNSYKADAAVSYLLKKEKNIPVTGKIIIYFKKDPSLGTLGYGSQIYITKPLQEIKNSGNPGGFNYKRYTLFNDIAHQVYLAPSDFHLLPGKNEKWIEKFLNSTRKKVLNILRTNIKGEKELGLAEALLIGYKNDLDKNLVQSYTNTGVVHIIAISGLHLGLIYWLLIMIFKPLGKQRSTRWLRPILVISGLWLFALLAGGQPSILRSAVMFTCIVLGESFFKKGYIFNTLALSAFLLLCWNPFFLWDVGFQLSYAAVLSIVIFMRPIYNWFYIKNKLLDFFWKLNAVTLSAQILTLPVSVYHFHQFPDFFLLTNFVAVPLGSVILIGEILLCAVSFIPFIAEWTGKILSWLIWAMNSYIERIEALPYSLWDGLQISILQAVLLVAVAGGITYWLIEKKKTGLMLVVAALLGFVFLRTASFVNAANQKKIIVYNVPRKQAIDFIDGRKYLFIGDEDLLEDDFARNFHLKPSRILHRISPADFLSDFYDSDNLISFRSRKIILMDRMISYQYTGNKMPVELLIISKNPEIKFYQLNKIFDLKQVVFDGSALAWKVKKWKRDCDSLKIPYHDVNEKGAFVMNLR